MFALLHSKGKHAEPARVSGLTALAIAAGDGAGIHGARVLAARELECWRPRWRDEVWQGSQQRGHGLPPRATSARAGLAVEAV